MNEGPKNPNSFEFEKERTEIIKYIDNVIEKIKDDASQTLLYNLTHIKKSAQEAKTQENLRNVINSLVNIGYEFGIDTFELIEFKTKNNEGEEKTMRSIGAIREFPPPVYRPDNDNDDDLPGPDAA